MMFTKEEEYKFNKEVFNSFPYEWQIQLEYQARDRRECIFCGGKIVVQTVGVASWIEECSECGELYSED